MADRELRYTMSAVAWIGVLLCSLALLTAATATAQHNDQNHAAAIGEWRARQTIGK